MINPTAPRQQLLEAIADLSDRQVILILQLIQALETKPRPPLTDPVPDPLAQFVGATTHGKLATAIDETLYD